MGKTRSVIDNVPVKNHNTENQPFFKAGIWFRWLGDLRLAQEAVIE